MPFTLSCLPFSNIQPFLNPLILLLVLIIGAHFQSLPLIFPSNAYSSFRAVLSLPSVSIFPTPTGRVCHCFLWSHRAEFFHLYHIPCHIYWKYINMSASPPNQGAPEEKFWNFVHSTSLAQCMCSKICWMNDWVNPRGRNKALVETQNKFSHPQLITQLRSQCITW